MSRNNWIAWCANLIITTAGFPDKVYYCNIIIMVILLGSVPLMNIKAAFFQMLS